MSKIESKVKRSNRAFRVRNRLKMVSRSDALRISVFKSNKNIYAQLIDDSKGVTIASSSSIKGGKELEGKSGVQVAKVIGLELGSKISDKKISNQIYFDRGSYPYHGRVKSLVEGLRESGVKI